MVVARMVRREICITPGEGGQRSLTLGRGHGSHVGDQLGPVGEDRAGVLGPQTVLGVVFIGPEGVGRGGSVLGKICIAPVVEGGHLPLSGGGLTKRGIALASKAS